MRVLIVEDDMDLCEAYRESLEGQGWSVVCVQDGYKGSRIITESMMGESLPDLAIIDLGLPNREGHKLVQQIRSNEEEGAPILPIFVISGMIENSLKEKLQKFEKVQILQKPILPQELVVAINSVVVSRG